MISNRVIFCMNLLMRQISKKVMTMAVEGSRDERRFTFVSGRVRYSVDTRSIMYFESELRRINLVTTEQKYVFMEVLARWKSA